MATWARRVRHQPTVVCRVGGASVSTVAMAAPASGVDMRDVPSTPVIEVPVLAAKAPAPPPEPVPVIYSTTFIQHSRRQGSQQSQDMGSSGSPPQQPEVSVTSTSGRRAAGDEEAEPPGNVFMGALRQVDRSLDELEHNPLPLQREIYEISRGPVGSAASTALSAAAQVTVAATKEAVKAALPIGQWMMAEGAKAAVKLVTAAVAESAKQQQKQQQKQQLKAKGRK